MGTPLERKELEEEVLFNFRGRHTEKWSTVIITNFSSKYRTKEQRHNSEFHNSETVIFQETEKSNFI